MSAVFDEMAYEREMFECDEYDHRKFIYECWASSIFVCIQKHQMKHGDSAQVRESSENMLMSIKYDELHFVRTSYNFAAMQAISDEIDAPQLMKALWLAWATADDAINLGNALWVAWATADN